MLSLAPVPDPSGISRGPETPLTCILILRIMHE